MSESRIHSSIDKLVATHDFVAEEPASIDQIVASEKALGTRFPEELKAFYLYANGLSTPGGFFSFISLPSLSLDWFNNRPYFEELGLVPLLDANDSNPLCIVTRGPLSGFIAHIIHDGDSKLRFKSIDDMLEKLSSATSFFDAYESCDVKSLPPSSSEEFDETLFEQLINGLDPNDQEGNSFRLCFAMDLCPDSEATRIANLIALGDEYVRDAALDRLKAIDSGDARRALAEDQSEYLSFVNQISNMAPRDRVERLNMPMLFADRNSSGFTDRLNRLLKLE